MLLLSNSLIEGFFNSNCVGKGIVAVQLISSVIMFATLIGKSRELTFVESAARRFMHDFLSGRDVLDFYLSQRPSGMAGIEYIYKETCERLLKLLTPDVRSLLIGRQPGSDGSAALTKREIELVNGTCMHKLDEEEIRVEAGMTIIASVVTLSPMLGLLGTVWGVLDAFADMGTAGSANLATIAPSISSALLTTVVGLIVAIPGVCFFNALNSRIRIIISNTEGFADELMGRIACEFQGRSD